MVFFVWSPHVQALISGSDWDELGERNELKSKSSSRAMCNRIFSEGNHPSQRSFECSWAVKSWRDGARAVPAITKSLRVRISVEQSGSSEPSPESPILKIKGNIEITNSREWANAPGGQVFQSAGRARPEGLRSRAVRQKIKLRQVFPPPTFFWVAHPSAIQENLRSCRGRTPAISASWVRRSKVMCHISCQCGVLTIVGSFCRRFAWI